MFVKYVATYRTLLKVTQIMALSLAHHLKKYLKTGYAQTVG